MYNQTVYIKKILINSLTLSRVLLTISFNLCLFFRKDRLLICGTLFIIIALTDFFDGKLARYYNVTSRLGAILDISTDFFFIFSASCLLYAQSLLPIGLIILISVKFAEFCFTSYLINKKLNINKALFFDKIGRIVAIMLYSFPFFALVLHTFLQRNISNLIILYTILLITGLSAVSIYRRVLRLIDVKSEM